MTSGVTNKKIIYRRWMEDSQEARTQGKQWIWVGKLIQWGPGKIVHDLIGSSMTYKSFCLFQCIWHPSRVTHPWCIANWNTNFWKKSLIFLCVLWGPVTIYNDFSGSNWQYITGTRPQMGATCIGTSRKNHKSCMSLYFAHFQYIFLRRFQKFSDVYEF